jgi:hypothetical protein
MSRHPSEDWRAFAGMLRRKASETKVRALNAPMLAPSKVAGFTAAEVYEEIADMALMISKGQYQ